MVPYKGALPITIWPRKYTDSIHLLIYQFHLQVVVRVDTVYAENDGVPLGGDEAEG